MQNMMPTSLVAIQDKPEDKRNMKGSETLTDTSGRGGGFSTHFYKARLLPEVQPLTLLYTIFHEKGTPFVYLLLTNGTPFTYLV